MDDGVERGNVRREGLGASSTMVVGWTLKEKIRKITCDN